MLKQWQKSECPSDEELKNRLTEARKKLELQQMEVKEHKLPVLVLVEGWGTAGKGSVIGQVIRNIDPRFFKVVSMDTPTPEELRNYVIVLIAMGALAVWAYGRLKKEIPDVL